LITNYSLYNIQARQTYFLMTDLNLIVSIGYSFYSGSKVFYPVKGSDSTWNYAIRYL